MGLKKLIRRGDKLFVKALLAHANLVRSDQQNRGPFGVEGEGNSHYAVFSVGSKFLQIGELQAIKRICVRPGKLRAKQF